MNLLSARLYDFIRDHDKEKQNYDNLDMKVGNDIDSLDNEYFYEIKKHVEDLHTGLDDLDAYSLLLQKQITTLKKEKVDLTLKITSLNDKLDHLEKDLGINIAAKRAKKKI
jgi:hypothetical protein